MKNEIEARCDCCSEVETADRETLIKGGWELYGDCQFCSEHAGV